MKRVLIICGLSALGFASTAQCDKKVIFNSRKVDFIDSLGNSKQTKEGKITVTLSKNDFALVHDGDEDDALKGAVKNLSCNWKDAFRNGKTTFECELVEQKSGEKNHAIVNIEGKDGNLVIQVKVATKGMMLQVIPENYTEEKE